METCKLKIKIGEHEFEAEGPTEIVQAQFDAFRDMVVAIPKQTPASPPDDQPPDTSELMLSKIMVQNGRVVSLTARGDSLEDEIKLVLLGQKNLRDNDNVTGSEIMDGLRITGRKVVRIDYQLDKMTMAGDVITIGTNRARRYRMTSQGFAKAQELAMALIETVV